ncbi:MAG: hypothetical protein JG776_2173 [Caloramator sp.]|jgi:hypothetical protein|uniref:stalk domain-containing protein n=1 Tax=Caloramator sp. TaxID=1871330 RepID=UPI001DDC4553|nr:stalk domain-containing protein [Caloramator sp.]MBZ4664455.1 hypothetical protein [Caloramator sp.]
MKRLQGFIIGFVVSCILLLNVNVFADSINVLFNSVNIKINGVQVAKIGDSYTLSNGEKVPFSISYKGTTYLPMRKLAELLGKEVTWDGKTKTASVNDKGTSVPTTEPIQIPSSRGNSFTNPAGVNDFFDVKMTMNKLGYSGTIEFNIGLTEVISGNEAWNIIKSADKYNEAAPDGKKYVLAKFKIKIKNISNANSFNLYLLNFDEYNSKGIKYDNDFRWIRGIKPSFENEITSNVEYEGYKVFIVDNSDEKPVVALDLESNGNKLFFSIAPTSTSDPVSTPTSTLTTSNRNISSLSELKTFLETNYSELKTCIGTTKFTFNIVENTRSFIEYDYWIQIGYEYDFFEGAMTSIKYTDKQKNQLRQELKNHQENLAKAVISAMPNKKFYGGYYDSWYKYPNLKIDLQTRRYYSWTNYDEPDILNVDINDIYNSTKPSIFRWYPDIDDEL